MSTPATTELTRPPNIPYGSVDVTIFTTELALDFLSSLNVSLLDVL